MSVFSDPALNLSARVGMNTGSLLGQAVGWNHAHQVNKQKRNGFFGRMGRHLGWNIAGAAGGTAAGGLMAAGGYLGYKAIRSRF